MIPEFRIVDDGAGAHVAFAGTHEAPGTNVDILTEMISVMNASRSYEADASLFDAGKGLAEKTIEMGRLS
jgi:flagellar basal body rod protein FlgC